MAVGCFGLANWSPPVRGGPLQISELVGKGDPTRRASTRLVARGLAAGDPQRSLTYFERAIKIDTTNPYAYLALASYEIQWGDVERGLQSLGQTELLLESQQLKSPRVEPHLAGLHGRARVRMGRDQRGGRARFSEGEELLERARRLAPDVWDDGWLSASELK